VGVPSPVAGVALMVSMTAVPLAGAMGMSISGVIVAASQASVFHSGMNQRFVEPQNHSQAP
jgi:hypothetical protein